MGSIFSAALDRTAARLDRWLGWDRLPLPLAILTLVGLRGRLRDENLLRHRQGPARRRARQGFRQLPHRADLRRDLQRPQRSADGRSSRPLRAERPAPVHLARARRGATRAESPPRQPPPPDARRVLARNDAEPPGRRLDPVRGARLVQPRPGRGGEPLAAPARRRGPLAREPDADPAREARPEPRLERAADVRDRGHALVGRLERLRRRQAVRRRAPHGREREAEDRRPGPAAARSSRSWSTSRASRATSGSASRSSTRSSCASTTRSATTCTRSTATWTTRRSTRRHA